MTLDTLFDAANKVGVIALLLLIGYAGYKKWWRFGYQFDEQEQRNEELRKDRDEWKALAMRTVPVSERTTALVERAVLGNDAAAQAQQAVQQAAEHSAVNPP